MRRLLIFAGALLLLTLLSLLAYRLFLHEPPPEIIDAGVVVDAEARPAGPCAPDCQGKACGPDGCGGECGACPDGSTCELSRCVMPPPICGDKRCDPEETCVTCGEDCACLEGAACSLDTARCACKPKCEGRECGPDGCGGNCGRCEAWQICDEGRCACAPRCQGKACGPDGCGGECGACPEGRVCSARGRCVQISPRCGDGKCRRGEDCMSCPEDCGECCGDRKCLGEETCVTCPHDCGQCCGDGRCGPGEDCANCAKDCRCDKGQRCDKEMGVCECKPDCRKAKCGDDGCGGSCGLCEAGEICNAERACEATPETCGDGECQPHEGCATCEADCGACCGNGACDPSESCVSCPEDCACGDRARCDAEKGRCVCTPSCVERSCGDDGCGGICGVCRGDSKCEEGRCVCIPDCKGRRCGGDGCGGSCGECGEGKACLEGGRCASTKRCGNGKCDRGEDCNSCPKDCGSCCGDDYCGPNETCQSCIEDCFDCCGDGLCEPHETCATCPSDCGDCCGNGACDANETCVSCAKDCGDCCGDGQCSNGENCKRCPKDCGDCCGDWLCGEDEDCSSCPKDCGACR